MRSVKALVFLGLAFLFAWPLGFGFFALGGRLNSGAFVAMALLYMWTPTVAAVAAQKLLKRGALPEWRLGNADARWITIAWLLPLLLAAVALGLSLAFPGVSLATRLDEFLPQLADKLSPAQLSHLHRRLDHGPFAIPGVLLVSSIVQAIVAGPTLNALAAFGEEFGWRGLLLEEMRGLGFWRASWLTGVAWGLWHLPLIVHGFNYPGHPLAGPLMMTCLTVLLSPLLSYVRVRSRSVWGAAVFHGTFNAAAGLVLFMRGGDSLLIGMTGVAGIATLAVANLALWSRMRQEHLPETCATAR